MRYIWAAYKKGCLTSMGGAFTEDDMDAETFKRHFEIEVTTNYHAAWTLFAETPKGFMPVGLVLGFYSHPDPKLSPFMIIGDMLWFPWTSARNKIEGAVHFFSRIRSQIRLMEYARDEDKGFFDMICKHGLMRRVGTTYSVHPGEGTAIYETRSP